MSYGNELAKARAMLEVPSIGASHDATISRLRDLVERYPDEARRHLAEIEAKTETDTE